MNDFWQTSVERRYEPLVVLNLRHPAHFAVITVSSFTFSFNSFLLSLLPHG